MIKFVSYFHTYSSNRSALTELFFGKGKSKFSKQGNYQSQEMQEKKKIYSPYSAKLKVIGSGAPGTPACVFLLTDQRNYLFNCGEGVQRLSQEHHCKLSKTENVFLTYNSWKNVGGLPGVLLTAQSSGLKNIKIHSPRRLDMFIETVQLFTRLPTINICHSTSDDYQYEDNILKITYVPITKSLENIKKSSSDLVNEIKYTNANGKRVTGEEEQEEKVKAKKLKINPEILCYICDIHPKAGKLLVSKCIDFGIGPGPLLNILKQGSDVTKEDGTIVYSKDVLEPSSNVTTFIVAECPSEEYLDSFVNHSTFAKYQQELGSDSDVQCIFHFTPEKIFNSHQYQQWLKLFSSSTEHIILNEENTCMGSESVYKNQYLLNMLHPEIFPLLNKDSFEKDKETINTTVYRARTAQIINLRPVARHLSNCDIYKTAKTYINEVYKIDNLSDVLKELKTNIDKKSVELNLNNISDYPRIVMLGTGCSVPNKIRNTSGILLRITADISIILDCGENTLGQLIRFYGPSEYKNILRTIKAIYISHIHADHHLGLIELLLKRKNITKEKLYLLVPRNLLAWLDYYNYEFESIQDQYYVILNHNLYLNHHVIDLSIINELYKISKIKSIDTVYVVHCKHSFGVAITLEDGKKIVYSGDTKFSANLITLGKNCDLLIHEATMDDGLEKLAEIKLHSTTRQAIKAGRHMNAKYILLTHFSQRYSKLPSIPDKETNVGIAYDYMEFKLPQLPLIPLFYPCLKVMFNEYNKVINN